MFFRAPIAAVDPATIAAQVDGLSQKSDRYLFLCALVLLCAFCWHILRRSFRQNDELTSKLEAIARESIQVHQRVATSLDRVAERLEDHGDQLRSLNAKHP